MSYSVRIKASAAKSLAAIQKPERLRLIETIDKLANDPHAGSALKGEFKGLRRIRVGDYRVIYEVLNNELVILVVKIGHRRDVYR